MRFIEVSALNRHWKDPVVFEDHDPHLQTARKFLIGRRRLPVDPSDPSRLILLLGPRQVGKTTVLKHSIEYLIKRREPPHPARAVIYLSGDAFASRRDLRWAFDEVLRQTPQELHRVLMLDEATMAPDWILEVKRLADEGKLKSVTLVATGSSAHDLKRSTERVPGRGFEGNTYFLKPLCFRDYVLDQKNHRFTGNSDVDRIHRSLFEALEKTGIRHFTQLENSLTTILPYQEELQRLFYEYLRIGGYPPVLADALSRPNDGPLYASARTAEILVRDLMGEVTRITRSETTTRAILRAILDREGHRSSYNAIARAADIHTEKVIEYISVLSDSFLLLIIEPIDPMTGKLKPRSEKKFLIPDPFLRMALESFLTGTDLDLVTDRIVDTERRAITIESCVTSHLALMGEIPYERDLVTFLNYAYRKGRREIDAVYRDGDTLWGIEVKDTMKARKNDIARFEGIDNYLLVTRDQIDTSTRDCLVLPACLLLALIKPSEHHL